MFCCRIYQESDGWASGEQEINLCTRSRAARPRNLTLYVKLLFAVIFSYIRRQPRSSAAMLHLCYLLHFTACTGPQMLYYCTNFNSLRRCNHTCFTGWQHARLTTHLGWMSVLFWFEILHILVLIQFAINHFSFYSILILETEIFLVLFHL